MIIMNFWKLKIGPYFQKSFWNEFFYVCQQIMPNEYIIEISKWVFILMDFVSFFSKISKVILPYQLTKTFFNMDSHLILKGFINE